MPLFTLLLAIPPASADPGTLQARLYDGAMDVARGVIEGQTFDYAAEELGAAYDCWDYIGVQNLNLEIPVEELEIGLDDGELAVWVRFGLIHGEDWVLYATDEEWTDTCFEFDTDVYSVQLEDAILDARLDLSVVDGALVVEAEQVEIIGELTTDIDWVPDDLVMSFFEQQVLETLAEQGGALLEEQIGEYLASGVLSGALGDYELALSPAHADVSPDGLELGANASLSWTGEDGCPTDAQPENEGRTPTLSFDDPGDADLAVGVTEALLDELVQGLWADGWFCFTEEDLSEFLATVQEAFDPDVGGLRATARLEEAPSVDMGEDGITLGLRGMQVEITGEEGSVSLLDATLDLSGRLELGVDPEVGSFTLSLHELSLDVRSLEADHLTTEGGAEDLAFFLERWATGWLAAQAQDLTLFGTLYRALGLVVRVDRLAPEEGGLVVFLSLYAEDDPEVDVEAPETRLSMTPHATGATLNWSAVDDREGDLAWSWRLDGQSWSSWTTEQGVSLDDLPVGEHTVEVVARDAWWNTDPTPASESFTVRAEAVVEEDERGCGCGGGRDAALLGVFGLLAASLRRRVVRIT